MSRFFERIRSNTTNIITIMHQNIAGLLSKKELLEICLSDFSEQNMPIDILCLSETFLKSGTEQNVRLRSFKLAAVFSRKNTKRGGVCILTKHNIVSKNLNSYVTSIEKHFECCAIEIPLHKIVVICIYRTPDSDINIFFKHLEDIFYKFNKNKTKRIIILGDLNIDTIKNSRISKDFVLLLESYNFKLHIKEPTRQKTCIDHIISNVTENVNAKTHTLQLSDHNTCQTISLLVDKKTYSN